MRKAVLINAALGLVVLAGCGGGGSSAGAGVERSYGPLTTRAVGGVAEPITMATAEVAVTGVFGANFTNISINLPPESQLNEDALLSTTQIAWSNTNQPNVLDLGTGEVSALTNGVPSYSNSCSPAWSSTGEFVTASEFDPSTGFFQIFVYSSDGSNRTRVTNNVGSKINPSFATNSTRIVYGTTDGDLWSVNRDGTNNTQLTSTPEFEASPRFFGSSAKIGYLRNSQYWEMNANGTGQAAVFTPSLGANGLDFDPTGTEFVTRRKNGANNEIVRHRSDGSQMSVLLSTVDELGNPSFSPTGSHVTYMRSNGGSAWIETLRIHDRSTQVVRTVSSTFAHRDPKWGPLVRRRNPIAAAGAVMHTNATGFLYSMRNSFFSSFLAFDAVTRHTADIDTGSSNGFNSGTLFASVTAADSINMLRYMNGFSTPRVTVVDPANPATFLQGAIVAFDGSTGKIAAVVGFNRGRSGPKPVRTEAAGRVKFEGDLAGVWNADGKQVADTATAVEFDAKTGEIVRTGR